MKSRVILLLAFLATLAATPRPAAADEYHYVNILVGDRASGMAGAYTAVSDDPSGMFYNPAGIAYASGRNISASVNAYHVTNKTYEKVIAGNGWKRTSSSLLPNYFGVIQPLGKFKVGVSYAVPESSLENQDQIFYDLPSTLPGITVDKYAINYNNSDTNNLFGPSVALEVNDQLAVGATLYVHKRNSHLIFNQYVLLSDARYQWPSQYLETDEWGIRPIVGVMWSPAERLSVGLTAAKTVVLTSKTLSQNTISTDVGGAYNDFVRKESDARREYPYQFKAGAAYFATPKLLLSADVSYFTPEDYTLFGVNYEKDPVINGALGVEYYFSPAWAVRAGLFSDRSNSPAITGREDRMVEQIDLYGGSLTVSRFTRNTSITAGGSFAYGDGQAHVYGGDQANPENNIQDVSASSWTLFLSSSYTY